MPSTTTGDNTSTTGAHGTATTSTTGGSTDSTGLCGDGTVDADEQCDQGMDAVNGNRDDGACTLDCKAAVCGDGKVWTDMEACDEATDNGTDYAGCSPTCQKNPHCGDAIVDLPFEQCDAGSANGSDESEASTVPCTDGCTWDARLVFLSSEAYDGDLGGLDGADQKCRTRAQAADLRRWETFRAWLSSGATGPLDRFTLLPAMPYVLPTGERIADSLADLVLDGPGDGIRVDEHGKPLPTSQVWTNTGVSGAPYSPVDHCSDWDSTAPALTARVGRSHVPHDPEAVWKTWQEDRQWTSLAAWNCLQTAHLYCFEQ